ncbi:MULTISPECIES: ABC-three component system protein [Vibrio]|uniref:ABC-three component system protein n=1 Tax=Vibrio TaxID=662 RepID=UPI0020C6B342|nr:MULTISPECIES: ABC-three component system protein [Vibrio]MCR9423274.1 serine protease [Vibrio sp. RM-69-4]
MTVSEIINSYCVKVNGGSGVLVNAMTREYSYVLTAAHVIPENQDEIVVNDYQNNRLAVLSVLIPPEWDESEPDRYDYAILKVDYQERLAQKCAPASDLTELAPLTLVGFPITERDSSDPIKEYTGHKISVANDLIIMFLDGGPGTTTIRGMSGGGVYHIKEEKPLLVGVEFQMDGTGSEQQYGRAQCHSLARFEELIAAYSSAPMIPAYLECFSNMRDRIFTFNVIDQNNVSNLKLELGRAADYLINTGLVPPYKVMERYHSDLLVEPSNIGELKTYELWVAYLEFLVISVLIDQSAGADDAYLKGLERKRRLIYTSNGTNWVSRLEDLLKTARRLLDKDGTLIVASPEPAARVLPPSFRLESVISNISVVPNQGPFPVIDSSESAILTSFKLTHLEGLRQKCVVDIEDEYPNLQSGKSQSDLLREKLSEIIN